MAAKKKWWEKYSYTPYEIISKIILFVILVYVILEYRGLLIAATVNGTPISRMSVVQESESQLGSQILENLVNQELIEQKAKDAHVEVTQEDIDTQLAEIEAGLEGSGQSLDSVLALQGMTRDMLVDQVKTQIMLEKLLSGEISVSDEEVAAYMEENSEFLPGEDEVSAEELNLQVRSQLEQQKLSERYQTWLQEVKEEADVKYYVEY